MRGAVVSQPVLSVAEELTMKATFKATMLRAADIIDRITAGRRDARSNLLMVIHEVIVTVSRAVIGISLMIATYAQAATLPTPSDLSSALTEARIAWGVQSNETIQFRLDPLNPCTLKDNPIIAQTQSLDTVTTMTFDDGTAPEVSHNLVWVIRINSNCDWSKLNLRNTITHELGHILISPNFHSANRRSIMYWIVSGDQKITPEDRAAVKRAAL